jgi:hypothetical protein
MTSPLGSAWKIGASSSALPSSGAPVSRRWPTMFSCSLIETRSQNSTSILISRMTL